MDEINGRLYSLKVGCYTGGKPSNRLVYAKDMAFLVPLARKLTRLLKICDDFARENLIEYYHMEAVVLLTPPSRYNEGFSSQIFLGDTFLPYVTKFKYLWHIITNDLEDGDYSYRKRRNLAVRGKILILDFSKSTNEVECHISVTTVTRFMTAIWGRVKNRAYISYESML